MIFVVRSLGSKLVSGLVNITACCLQEQEQGAIFKVTANNTYRVMMADLSFSVLGFTLILAGVLVLVAATILIAIRGKNSNAEAAGVIIIGPIPIVLSSDKKSAKTLLTLSTLLTALLIVGMLIYYFLFR